MTEWILMEYRIFFLNKRFKCVEYLSIKLPIGGM